MGLEMKCLNILHIGILSHYTEGMTYQDNMLSEINVCDGHRVTFITDTYYYKSGKLVKGNKCDTVLPNGMRLIRVEYDWILNRFLTEKIQRVSALNMLLESIKPEVILYHGLCGYELMDVASYVKKNENVKFYADSHEDFNNTARTWLSKVAYKYIHGHFVKKALPYIDNVFYLTEETKYYLQKMYKIRDGLLEWYPLGGILSTVEEQVLCRKKILSELQLPEDCILLGHSGKMDKGKRTKELLCAFQKIDSEKLYLLIWGSIPEKEQKNIKPLIESQKRVKYLGWKQGEQITELLNAVDVYCQPGTQSTSMQNAMCCGCALVLYPHLSYQVYLHENGYFVETEEDIVTAFKDIALYPNRINQMKKKSYAFAEKYLDYRKLAARLYK